ncbi:MAG: PA2169 family four-helix-bundle protein [Gemmatimonadetes bacterium]|nr:PA2169 family four-helix-bundle protein [Gemmatimonadota bacterium]
MAIETNRAASARPGGTAEILAALNDLLQLDHDAIGAYQVAVERLEDRSHAQQIQVFLLDHERHVQDLNRLIQELGGTPRNEPHASGPLKQAIQGLGGLGGDKGTLMAFRTNEMQVRTRYQGYLARAGSWPGEVRATIDRNALDEERHFGWVDEVLLGMGVSAASAVERARGLRDGASRLGADAMELAAASLQSIAEAQAVQGGVRARAGEAAQRLAGGMQTTAGFLREPDPEQLRDAVQEQVKTNPLRALAVTFAAGFVIGRILR